MNTNEFALAILTGIKQFLAWIGIPSHLLDKLDELDDVQDVYHNVDLPEDDEEE